MIHYEGARFHPRLLFQKNGSVCYFAATISLPCALLSATLKFLIVEGMIELEEYGFLGLAGSDQVSGAAYAAASSLLGFLVVFRTSQAYSRFWEGCSSLHDMQSEWFDAASSLVAFCKMSPADLGDCVLFQHTLVRLMSMLNAVVLVHLNAGFEADPEDMTNSARAFELELIDAEGLDAESLECINNAEHKVELCFQWIQQLIVETTTRGIFSVAPPILSRAFQELANGMVKYHACLKIATTPLPFPYMQVMEWMLVIHWWVTPFLICIWVQTPLWAGALTFLQVFFFWTLNAIAGELENPFGEDVNDLPALEMQLETNKRLLLLLRPSTQKTPHLSEQAAFDETPDGNSTDVMKLGSKQTVHRGGITRVPSQSVPRLQRRMTMGSLMEGIRDVEKTAYTVGWGDTDFVAALSAVSSACSEDPQDPTSSVHTARSVVVSRKSSKHTAVGHLSPTCSNVWRASAMVEDGSTNDFQAAYADTDNRGLEEQLLRAGEDLLGQFQQLRGVCQEIRDEMRGLSDSQKLLTTLENVVNQRREVSHKEGGDRPHGPTAPPFCCAQLHSSAKRVQIAEQQSSFSEHPS